MEADEEKVELIQRRESEEVEDIESSSEIASEDEQKPDEPESKNENPPADEVDVEQGDAGDVESAEVVDEPKDVAETEPKKETCLTAEDAEKSSSKASKDDKHGKDLDIEGELDYEDEAPVKEDESEGEHEDEEGEIETENKSQEKEKEEGEEDDDEDDGECTDDDLEEGEVKDSSSSRKTQPKSICRFFHKGQCTWGLNCRFIHPGINDKGNYNMFSAPPAKLPSSQSDNYHSTHAEPEAYVPPPPPPPPPVPARDETPAAESAWERGLRHAKEIIKKSIKRKETEPDFEEKRMNLTLVEGEIQAEYEKDSDYYSTQPRRRAENEQFYHYSVYEEAAYREAYDRQYRDAWHNSRSHEAYNVQWTHHVPEYDYRDYRDRSNRHYPVYERERERERDNRETKDARERIDYRNQERWREDRYVQPLSNNRNVRADEWRDPWRRSKSPKASSRRSWSKGRSKRSYSSASSASYSSSRSSRSRSSSYSYSKSHSSSRSSRSRSYSLSPARSKSRSPGGIRTKSNHKSIHTSSASIKKTPSLNTHRNSSTVNNGRSRAKSPVALAVPSKRKAHLPEPTPPVMPKRKITVKGDRARSPSWSGSASSRSRSPPIHPRSRSRSLSISSVSSVSSSVGSLSGDDAAPRNPVSGGASKGRARAPPQPAKDRMPRQVSREVAKKPPERPARIVTKISKDPLKQSSAGKPQIKLTLLKPSSDKTNAISKRKTIDEMMAEKQKADKAKATPKQPSSKKRPATSPAETQPPSKAAAPPAKKSTSSRREELLKQLRAVEDAIARKRTKF